MPKPDAVPSDVEYSTVTSEATLGASAPSRVTVNVAVPTSSSTVMSSMIMLACSSTGIVHSPRLSGSMIVALAPGPLKLTKKFSSNSMSVSFWTATLIVLVAASKVRVPFSGV